jgi:hypothetical protein
MSEMFNGNAACGVRAIPNGKNDIQTFKSVKGQNIQHWILLAPMPGDIDSSEYIPEFISKFQALCKRPYIRSAYKTGVEAITKHSGLVSQITQEGIYWNVLDNAIQGDIIFQYNISLSEVLMDSTITDIVSIIFGLKKDQSAWPESVKTYAYGN